MAITRREAITNFLRLKTHPDLASLYTPNMEVQVSVAQGKGERIEGEYKGKKWNGWSDGITTWKPFRIPFKAKSEPEYTDSNMTFDLAEHADGIGMTGWDWVDLRSRWVAYDFDSIVNHNNNALSDAELEDVIQAATEIPWVTVRKSTSGHGLHLYVFLDADIRVANHTEHAALARAILGKMSALTGYSFASKIDACGGNIWVWHRKMPSSGEGLKLIKQGTLLGIGDIPANWKEHLNVIRGSRHKTVPVEIEQIGRTESFEELCGQHPRVPLDDIHKQLLSHLQEHNLAWEWDQDNHMLITHTAALKQCFLDLGLKGYYETSTSGSSRVNCFAFPLRRGAWVVRRYTPGVQEHPSWEQDGSGWTRCYLNREPDLATVCRAFGAIEHPKGGYVFREADVAQQAALLLGVDIKVAPALLGRKTIFKQHKDGRLVVEIERDDNDRGDDAEGYLADKKVWTRIYTPRNTAQAEPEAGVYDDVIRHMVGVDGRDAGWSITSEGRWHYEPLVHIKAALASMGVSPKDNIATIGGSIFRPWKLVNKPFQGEYPGNREWNHKAAQFRFPPTEGGNYATWLKILNHCGSGLDDKIKKNAWCRANGILTGGDYLKCWIASVLQHPSEPLPYLFFYNDEQNTGKSTFHEAVSLLMTNGVAKAESALTNPSGFNGELLGAVVCTVEEVDLSTSKVAYNRMKDWVTGREMLIHPKNCTPFNVVNTTHWVQCANSINACPIFAGDTRVTMIYVKAIDPMDMIPKRKLIRMLEAEASDFIGELITLDLPDSPDRLMLPPIDTDHKAMAQRISQNPVESFVEDNCKSIPGAVILFSDFYDRFMAECIPQEEQGHWSKIKVGRMLPERFPKGRLTRNPQVHIGNLAWNAFPQEEGRPYIKRGEFLAPISDEGEVPL
jgi:hypothetical protein